MGSGDRQQTDISTAFAFDVVVKPLEGTAGGYLMEATITDMTNDEVLSAPRVEFLSGADGARVVSRTPAGLQIESAISVLDEANNKAIYYSTISRDGQPLHRQAVAFELAAK